MIYLSEVRTCVFVCEDDVVVNKRRRWCIPVWWGKRLTCARRYIRCCRCNRSTPIWHCSCERRDVLKGDNGVVLNGTYRSALTFWVPMEFQSWSMKKIYSSFPLFHSCLKPVVKKTFDTCLILLQLWHKRFFTFFVFN